VHESTFYQRFVALRNGAERLHPHTRSLAYHTQLGGSVQVESISVALSTFLKTTYH
jgi:hypothetical protein